MRWISKKNILALFFIFLATVPIILQIFQPGLWITDDAEWMIIRNSAFYQELRGGQFPVRWLGRLNHEYGYPVANFLYPGFLYLGSAIHFLGLGFIDSIKTIFALSVIVLGIGLYYWLKILFKPKAAFVGAIFGIYSPYFLFDIFNRGSIGEVLGLATLALVFFAVEKGNLIFAGIAYGWLILAHNTLALMATPVLFFYIWIRNKGLFKSLILGLGLSCFFWLPAILEQPYVIFSQTVISNWKEYWLTANISFLTYAWTSIILVLGIFVSKISFVKNKHFILFTFVLALSLFLASQFSSLVWVISPLPKLIQFPWRFLSLMLIASSYFVAALLSNVKPGVQNILTITFLTMIFVNFLPYRNLDRSYRTDGYYETNDATTTVHDEYMPVWVKDPPKNLPAQKISTANKEEIVFINKVDFSRIDFIIDVPEATVVDIHKLYYPGWKVIVNNKIAQNNITNNNGYINIPIKGGRTHIKAFFSETFSRKLANAITILSALAVFILIYLRFSKRSYRWIK